jgi:tetratricopeptide (TPR) repeat protein/predicted Ser/Thr protein kinase
MRFAHFIFDPVQDLLGEGPLSEVYRATDEKLERTVALKILRAHVEIDPEADMRFEREARHTSHLMHPNIATIYEYGVDSGRSFIAMEYLQGRTLDKIIANQMIGVDEGLRIALQLTSALALVHKSGLIHRDLKPANVMVLHDGTVKLLDFGIARADGESNITQHGMLVGTVLYMSPEQVRGDELDPRSDIFSLGSMLYHAFGGVLPFPGTSFPEVCMAILDAQPKPLIEVRRGLNKALGKFIMKCLSSDPAERYDNAEVAGGVLMAISDSIASGTGTRQSFIHGRLAMPPIAVANGSVETHALAASMRKDIAAELKRSGMAVELIENGSLAGERVDFVTKGALKLEGETATLEFVLEHCRNSSCEETSEVWRERIVHSDGDEWALQAQLVRHAVRSLRRQLAEHSLRPVEQTKRDPQAALDLCMRAHTILHRGMTRHLLSSIMLFRRALEADHLCALAYAGLAEALARKFLYWDGDESFIAESRENARRALGIAPDSAEAHTSLGFANHLTGHSVDAQREYRLAIQLKNDEWLAHRLLGSLLSRGGNFKGASPLLQRAIALKPNYISTYDHLFYVLQRLDRYQEAIEIADRGIGEAKRQIRRFDNDQDSRMFLAMLQARMGLREDALATLAEARENGPKDGFTSFHTSSVHAVLGNPEEALEALLNAQARGFYIRLEQRNSEFDILRGIPEFQALVH